MSAETFEAVRGPGFFSRNSRAIAPLLLAAAWLLLGAALLFTALRARGAG